MFARISDQEKLEKIPSRLEPIFREIDQKGLLFASRNNGQFEITDAPLSTVAEKIKYFTENQLGGFSKLKKEETEFLLKIGINPKQNFQISHQKANSGITRWTLTGLKSKAEDESRYSLRFDYSLSDINPNNAHGKQIESFLGNMLIRLGRTAGLSPSEMPSRIIFVSNETGVDNMAVNPDLDTVEKGFSPSCEAIKKMRKQKPEPASLEAISKPLDKIISAIFQKKQNGGTLLIPDAQYGLVYRALEEGVPDSLLQETLGPSYAFLMAHELGHLLQWSKTMPYEFEAYQILTSPNSFIDSKNISLRGVALCGLINYIPLDDILNSGIYKPDVKEKIKSILHHKEYDADVLGFYVALKAGYPTGRYSSFFLDQIEESITHPAEKATKVFVSKMEDEAKKMGFRHSD